MDSVDFISLANSQELNRSRLASLQKSGEEEWRKRVPRLKSDTPELIISRVCPDDERSDKSDQGEVQLRPKVSTSRPISLNDRLSKLQSAQTEWQKKVGEKDTDKFTVAGKMERENKVKSVLNGDQTPSRRERSVTPKRGEGSKAVAEPVARKTPKTPRMAVFKAKASAGENDGGDRSPARTRPVSCIDPSTVGASNSQQLLLPRSNSIKRVSLPETSAPTDAVKQTVVTIPEQDTEHLEQFFQTFSEEKQPDVAMSPEDLDSVKGGPLLSSTRSSVARPRKNKRSRNPIKSLAARTDLTVSYTETVVSDRELDAEPKKSKEKSAHSHLAKEALAGLASTEDFTNVQLRRGTALPHQSMLPYRDTMLIQVANRKKFPSVASIVTNNESVRTNCFTCNIFCLGERKEVLSEPDCPA